jgi:hypothetical protein
VEDDILPTHKLTSRSALYYVSHALLVASGLAINAIHGPFWTAIGTGLVGTGVAGAVIYVYIARTETVSARLESLQESGIQRIYMHRAAQIRPEYDERLTKAQNQIDIVGFGLKDFRRDYLAQFGAMSSRATIRVLLLDPDSPYAAQRDEEEGQSPGTIRSEIIEFLKQYKAAYSSQPGFNTGKLTVRIHKALPTVNIFRIDDELFWGPYLMGLASGNTVTMRVRRGGLVFNQLSEHFDRLWGLTSTVEPSWPVI